VVHDCALDGTDSRAGCHGGTRVAGNRHGGGSFLSGKNSRGTGGRGTGRAGRSWHDRSGDGNRRTGSVSVSRNGRENISPDGGGYHAVSIDADGLDSVSNGCTGQDHVNTGKDTSRNSDDVNDSTDNRVTDCVNRENDGCGSSCGQDSNKSDGAAAADVENTQSQSAFVRQQRMRWLQSTTHTMTKQSSLQSQMATTDNFGKRSEDNEDKPTVAVSTVSCSDHTVTITNSAVAVCENNTTAMANNAPRSERQDTQTEPIVTHTAEKETQQTCVENGEGDGKDLIGENLYRNFQKSQNGSGGGVKLTISETEDTKDKSKKETEATVNENRSTGLDGQRLRYQAASKAGIPKCDTTDCELQQQRVWDAGSNVSLKLTTNESQSVKTRINAAATVEEQVQNVSTLSSLVLPLPVSELRAPSTTQKDVNSLSSRRLLETSETNDSLVSSSTSDAISTGLQEVFSEIRNFSKRDCEPATRAAVATYYSHPKSVCLEEPLMEDAFDVYVKQDELDFWSQGCLALESTRAQLQDICPNIKPLEDFADSEDTPLKLPVVSASEITCDKREEVGSGESQNACENETSDRSDVEKSSSITKTLPCCTQSSTCVYYSRSNLGIGKVLPRCLPTFRYGESWNSVLGSTTTAAKPVLRICDKTVAVQSQSSNKQSVNSPVFHLLNDQDTVANSTKQTIHHDAASQEYLSSTTGKVNSSLCQNSTVGCGSVGQSLNAVVEPRDSTDSLNSLPKTAATKTMNADSGSQVADTVVKYAIPVEMEADFIEQMHHETCHDVPPSSTRDFSSELSLHIIVTHVVDARHFWGQIVNEGIQVILVFM